MKTYPFIIALGLFASTQWAEAQSGGNNATPKAAQVLDDESNARLPDPNTRLPDPYRPAGGPKSGASSTGTSWRADIPVNGTAADPTAAGAQTSGFTPVMISLQWEVYSLPLAESRQFLATFKTDVERYSEIVKMSEAGNAALEELLIVRTRSGQRAKVEGINELIYPTEFVPPHQPAESPRPMIANPGFTPQGVPINPKPSANAPAQFIPQPTTPGQAGNGLPYPSPTAFETRNAGSTLEVEPTLGSDGETIDATVAPELVRFIGNEPQTPDRSVMQPKFQTQKMSTSITLKSGRPFLLGTQSPSHLSGVEGANQEKLVWLSFITAEAVSIR